MPQDYAEAAKWYRKAADQGFAQAHSYSARVALLTPVSISIRYRPHHDAGRYSRGRNGRLLYRPNESGERLLRPLKTLSPLLIDGIGTMPYTSAQKRTTYGTPASQQGATA